MSISVVIPFRQDPFIHHTLNALLSGIDPSRLEVIVVDDFSDIPLEVNGFSNVRVIRNSRQRGVGSSFDIGCSYAIGDILILMGSDVLVQNSSWIDSITDYVSKYPESIGCSTCVSLNKDNLNPNDPTLRRRYGARLHPLYPDSENTGMFVTQWFNDRPTENIVEIPCLLGAFYFTTRSWYQHIGGWDNSHCRWGNLESWLSLKTWLSGGSLHLLRDTETGHIFKEVSNNGRSDYMWYNRLFVAHTQLPEDLGRRLISKCYSLLVEKEQHTYPFNLGKRLIRQNWNKVLEVRERNDKLFTRDFIWYCEKFGIDINF